MGARDTEVTWRDLLPILRQTGRQRIPVSAKGCEEEKAGFRQSQGGEFFWNSLAFSMIQWMLAI